MSSIATSGLCGLNHRADLPAGWRARVGQLLMSLPILFRYSLLINLQYAGFHRSRFWVLWS